MGDRMDGWLGACLIVWMGVRKEGWLDEWLIGLMKE